MAEGKKSGIRDPRRHVQVYWLPTYREVRQLLGVLPGPSQGARCRTAVNREPTRWQAGQSHGLKDPDTWIPERLSGENRELAHTIWTRTDGVVNPRYAEYAPVGVSKVWAAR